LLVFPTPRPIEIKKRTTLKVRHSHFRPGEKRSDAPFISPQRLYAEDEGLGNVFQIVEANSQVKVALASALYFLLAQLLPVWHSSPSVLSPIAFFLLPGHGTRAGFYLHEETQTR
jgi:hypothetical protein